MPVNLLSDVAFLLLQIPKERALLGAQPFLKHILLLGVGKLLKL